jgi:hypothetical protein
MSFRGYEILLPTRYNDGTPVEPEEFLLVNSELAARFGAVSFLPEIIHGVWLQQGQRFEDENVRLFVDVEDSPAAEQFFKNYKETLKHRFRQLDIWIVSFEIRIT